MDLMIFNPRMTMISSSLISNGPIAIASYIEAHGFNVSVIDDNSQYRKYSNQEYFDLINSHNPLVVGLGMNTLNAYTSYRLFRDIRNKFSDQIIVSGGLHSYDSAHEMAGHTFDVIFKGEAEIALFKFLQVLKKHNATHGRKLFDDSDFIDDLKKIPGILFREKKDLIDTGPSTLITNMDELPLINHELANLSDYIRWKYDHYGVTNCLNFQRGCPYQCTYCKAGFMSGRIRANSALYIFKQIQSLHEKYGIDQFNIQDANFPIDKKRLKEFCNLMISSDISKKIKFWCQTSVTVPLNDEYLDMLKDAGVSMISVGVERFDDDFRKLMNKAGTGEQAFKIIKRIKKHKIKTNVNILVNFPEETKETIARETNMLEKALPYIDYYGVNYLIPLPGTGIYKKKDMSHTWYLQDEIINKSISYYDIAYNVTTAGLEFNVFNLPRDVTKSLRLFKERFYRKSILRINRSLIFKFAFYADMLVARLSFYTYSVSPKLEGALFALPKFIRVKGAKYFMNKFVMRSEA